MRHAAIALSAATALVLLALVGQASSLSSVGAQEADDEEFISLFNGKDLTGWKIAKTGHGTGGKWEVADGVITGTQDKPGNGGLLLTEEKYGDFEAIVEINPDWNIDSGLFLRSKEDGACYQLTVDYRPGGQVGTLYGEGIGGWLAKNDDWEKHYKRDTWNTIRTIVRGQPPRIEAWLNDEKIVDFQDDKERLPREGYIALQIHGGGDWQGRVTRFKNIRLKPLQ